MKRRLAMLFMTVLAAGSLQVVIAPAASASTSTACADPNCPWSPITGFVRGLINEVDRICDEHTTTGCPL